MTAADDAIRATYVQTIDTLTAALRLRTAALGRVVEQLDAVRALHVKNESGRCKRCREVYPCETARAAGVPMIADKRCEHCDGTGEVTTMLQGEVASGFATSERCRVCGGSGVTS